MLLKLTQTKVLWFTFAVMVILTLGFVVVMEVWGFTLIDEMYDPAIILSHIENMSTTQKRVHIWTTATLDVLYPFAYAGFFIGMALRYFGRFGPWLAIPSIVVIPVDLTEGLVQVLLLNGGDQYVGIKAIVTPLKLGLFLFGLAIAIIGLGIAIYQWVNGRRKRER